MRRAAQLLLVFLLSAVVTVGVASLLGMRVGGLGERLGAGSDGESPLTQLPDTVAQLRQRQDEYLRVLLGNPADAAAMRGLVAVRRRLAGDDPMVLRRQAAAYQQMITSGAESPEHYSRQPMELLASASLRAAAAVESEQRNMAQRGTRTAGPLPAPGSSPSSKGAFTPPALPSPAEPDKVNPQGSVPAHPAPSKPPVPDTLAQPSQTAPGKATVPSTPPPPTAPPPHQPAGQPGTASPPPAAQPSTPPAQPPPPAPPAGSTTPQPPAAGQTVPPASPEGTIAVVPPQSAGPEVTQTEGSLAKVDCQKKTFVLHGSNGDEEYLTAQNITIYIRGIGSERLSDFCGLQRHVGHAAMVWWVPDGDRKIARSMSVVLQAQ